MHRAPPRFPSGPSPVEKSAEEMPEHASWRPEEGRRRRAPRQLRRMKPNRYRGSLWQLSMRRSNIFISVIPEDGAGEGGRRRRKYKIDKEEDSVKMWPPKKKLWTAREEGKYIADALYIYLFLGFLFHSQLIFSPRLLFAPSFNPGNPCSRGSKSRY